MCGVQFGLARLRAENQGGYTQASLAKEIFTEAREKKKDIQQVRGRRRPHEVMRSEGWVKT
jgi:hypothetical protein